MAEGEDGLGELELSVCLVSDGPNRPDVNLDESEFALWQPARRKHPIIIVNNEDFINVPRFWEL